MPADFTDIYAFVGWIGTIASYAIFLTWALVPDDYLRQVGITYYPSKYYALALPCYVIVCIVLVILAYVGISMILNPDPDDTRTVCDCHSRRIAAKFHCVRKGNVPEIGDIDAVDLTALMVRDNYVVQR